MARIRSKSKHGSTAGWPQEKLWKVFLDWKKSGGMEVTVARKHAITLDQVRKVVSRCRHIAMHTGVSRIEQREFNDRATQGVYHRILDGLENPGKNKYWLGRGPVDVGKGLGVLAPDNMQLTQVQFIETVTKAFPERYGALVEVEGGDEGSVGEEAVSEEA